MERDIRQEIKVGIAVLGVLLVIGISAFLLGGSSDLLKTRYRLNASFEDISGLREGAVVRLAGIDVGEVTHIDFAEDPGDKRVFVQISLMEEFQTRIRKDSVASIQTEGVLGDKYITVSIGSTDQPILMHTDWIQTNEPLEFLSYMGKASEILDNSAGISRKINFILGEDKDSARASLANSIIHLEGIIREIQEGDGVLHALIYDKAMAVHVQRSMANLEETTASLNRLVIEMETGDGFAHQLIYGSEGQRLTEEITALADSLRLMTLDLKSDDSLAHALLYDPERVAMVDELSAAATSLREVAESIQSGQGTAGMLANDPSLYEDLRALVGGAQRNKLLRSYIRHTIEKSEEKDASPWEPVGE